MQIHSTALAVATALSLSTAGMAQAVSLVNGPRASIRLFNPGTSHDVSMATIDDQNADGLEDLLVGVPDADFWLVLDGRNLAPLARLQDPTATGLGRAVTRLGDIDQDGVGDFAVSNRNLKVLVYTQGGLFQTIAATNLIGSISEFGNCIASIGDITGDGIEELAIGDPECDGILGLSRAGMVEIIDFTTPGAPIPVLRGAITGDNFGSSITGLGDITGDGRADFAVGSRRGSTTPAIPGQVQVFNGATLAVLATLPGINNRDEFGWSVANVGDLDLDGLDDLAVGARYTGTQATSYVRAFSSQALSGGGGFAVPPLFTTFGAIQASRNFFGHCISRAGDHNQDGVPDLLVGSPELSSTPPSPGGSAAILSGANGAYLSILTARAVSETFGFATCELPQRAKCVLDSGTGYLHLY